MNVQIPVNPDVTKIADLFERTRGRTTRLVAPLTAEDMMLQSMQDASPAKWHLAHTTWFFEEFILRKRLKDYQSPCDQPRMDRVYAGWRL